MDYGLQDIDSHIQEMIRSAPYRDPAPLASAFNHGAEIRGLPQADFYYLQKWFHYLMIQHYMDFEESRLMMERLKRPPIDPR